MDEYIEHITVEPQAAVLETCRSCGRAFGIDGLTRSNTNRDFCVACARKERNEIATAKKDNSNWIMLAQEAGVPLWEQQAGETTDEYDLWVCYRDLWPEVRPTVSKVAKALGVTVQTVQRAFNKWTWSARLQAWIREVNADKTAELRANRRTMVEEHIQLGEKLRKKMLVAVDELDPEDLTPGELVSLLKETQRLEETARDAFDALEAETANDVDGMPDGLFAKNEDSKDGGRNGISVDDAAEVIEILTRAGVMQVNGAKVGVRQTTEIVGEF